jgi:hypothetical protein
LDSLQREEREVRRDNGCYRREEDLTVHRDLCSADDEEKRDREDREERETERRRGQGGEGQRREEVEGKSLTVCNLLKILLPSPMKTIRPK